jgi:nucleotide-binding universal stress UspA family protein
MLDGACNIMKTVLVAVDFSDVTLKVVKAAIHLAKPFQSRIILMHVTEIAPQLVTLSAGPDAIPMQPVEEEVTSEQFAESLKRLQEMVSAVGLESTTLSLRGPPVELILRQTETSRVDLIVLGSHGRGPLYHLFAGGVADGILKRAKCPVLIVPLHDQTT